MVVSTLVENHLAKASTFIAKEFSKVWFLTEKTCKPNRSRSKSKIIVLNSSVAQQGSTVLHSLLLSTFGSWTTTSSEAEASQCVVAEKLEDDCSPIIWFELDSVSFSLALIPCTLRNNEIKEIWKQLTYTPVLDLPDRAERTALLSEILLLFAVSIPLLQCVTVNLSSARIIYHITISGSL